MSRATLISRLMRPRRTFVLQIVTTALCLAAGASAAFSQSDFSVTKTASSSTIVAGNNITYTITVTNEGPGVANFAQVTFSDAIPEDTTFVSFSQVGTTYSCVTPLPGETTSVNCFNQTSIIPGTSTQFTLVVAVDSDTAAGTVITNTALVGFTFDTNSANNSATATTTVVGPSAAMVSISGRVVNRRGLGIRNVLVRLVNEQGESRLALTSSFGFYRFTDVAAGQPYAIAVSAKRYTFAEPVYVLTAADNVSGFDFVAEQ